MFCEVQNWQMNGIAPQHSQCGPCKVELFCGLNAGPGTMLATAFQRSLKMKMRFTEKPRDDCSVKTLTIFLFTSPKCLLELKK